MVELCLPARLAADSIREAGWWLLCPRFMPCSYCPRAPGNSLSPGATSSGLCPLQLEESDKDCKEFLAGARQDTVSITVFLASTTLQIRTMGGWSHRSLVCEAP